MVLKFQRRFQRPISVEYAGKVMEQLVLHGAEGVATPSVKGDTVNHEALGNPRGLDHTGKWSDLIFNS